MLDAAQMFSVDNKFLLVECISKRNLQWILSRLPSGTKIPVRRKQNIFKNYPDQGPK